jgi:ubiquinone/menaquinone biosynthesis C-methylase UbiE
MKKNKIQIMKEDTKKAWGANWEQIGIERILEIFNYTRVLKFFETIKPYLPEGGKLLEAGCGLGPWVIKLNEEGYDTVGVDYQQECIAKIKEYDERLAVYDADIRHMPFDNAKFDAYLSWGVIEHFPEGPEEALQEANRVLKTNGKIILTVPFLNLFRILKMPLVCLKRNKLIRKIFKASEKSYYYQKYFSTSELRKVIEAAGFEIEKIIPVDQIFSLVEFSGIFRDYTTLDGENKIAVSLGEYLEKIAPWASAGSTLVVGKKK